MKIESVRIDSVLPDPANARRHPARNLDAIKGSLARFGQQKPIIVTRDNVIRAGNGTWQAAKELGWTKIDVVRTDLQGSEATAFSIADNRTAELATWDPDMLEAELSSLTEDGWSSEDLDKLGFNDKEIEEVIQEARDIADSVDEGTTEEDEPPPILPDPVTRDGDLWILRNHRLLCGDSTKAADVARVMAGERAGLMNTDPPYGVGYVSNAQAKNQASDFKEIENDDLDGEKLQKFLESSIRAAVPHLQENAAFYLWHPMLTQGTFFAAAAAAAADILIHRQIIWAKPSFVFGRGDYHWRHELCFYGWKRGNRPPFYGERNQDTLWSLGRENDKVHPTQKPVELFAIPMRNHTHKNEICYEPFGGSGSQFIAAEQLGRRCYGLEIEPRYCDVIVRRWEKLTGLSAILESTGLNFPAVAAGRGVVIPVVA